LVKTKKILDITTLFYDILPGMNRNKQLFIREYCKDRNGTRAYRASYPGCSTDKAAGSNAEKFLKNPEIRAAIDKNMKKLFAGVNMPAERILLEEGRIAFQDFRQAFNGDVQIPPSELPEDIARAVKDVTVKTRNIFHPDGRLEVITTYKYSFWDKGAALQRLERHLGMDTEHIDLNVIDDGNMSPTEAFRRLAFLMRRDQEKTSDAAEQDGK